MVTNFQIFERKQVGVIYHFTSIDGLRKILEQNQLLTKNMKLKNSDKAYLSFTRSKHPYSIKGREKMPVRIVLDGDKLSDTYKIEPYDYFSKNKLHDETEERIILSSKHKIDIKDNSDYIPEERKLIYFALKNIKKYIIKVDINIDIGTTYDEIMYRIDLRDGKIKYPGIEINFVEKW